jgi:hypothetical protein
MATASNFDDLLQCPICLDILHDPKVLDCQHTFCATCLKVHLASTARLLGTQNFLDCKFSFNYPFFLLLITKKKQVQHVVHDQI